MRLLIALLTRLGNLSDLHAGPRSAKSIADAGTALLTEAFVNRPKTAEDFEKFKATADTAKVVLFTDKPRSTTLFKSLSMRFRGRLAFAEVRDINIYFQRQSVCFASI